MEFQKVLNASCGEGDKFSFVYCCHDFLWVFSLLKISAWNEKGECVFQENDPKFMGVSYALACKNYVARFSQVVFLKGASICVLDSLWERSSSLILSPF